MEKKRLIWERGCAGNHLTLNIPVVGSEVTIEQTKIYLEYNIKNLETIEYIYVVEKNKKLVGVFSSKNLYSRPPQTRVINICKKSLRSVKPTDKQEYAAHLSSKHGLSAIPVVENNLFLGVITRNKILQILHKQHTEEVFQVAGIHKSHAQFDDIFKISIFQSIKHRIIWLIIGLLGGILAANIIGYFESTLQKNIILVSFIPLVVYIADAVGTQLEAFSIRDFSLFKNINFHLYFVKQFSIVSLMAVLLGLIISLVTLPFVGSTISFILGISIFGAAISSVLTGLFIPFIFKKLKKDPVNGSGPIGTILQDIISVVIYLAIASSIL